MSAIARIENVHREVIVPADGLELQATLDCPRRARGLIVFAHGGGINRFSPRNRLLASVLHGAPFATLLVDLLTEDEESRATSRNVMFDVPVLARRLVAITDWIAQEPDVSALPIGYLGATTGAAAALQAAAERPEVVRAIVSRSGRPDLAGDALDRVASPTLLIVTGHDREMIRVNRMALERLTPRVEAQLAPVVAADPDVFESPEALTVVGDLAIEWFTRHLAKPNGRAARRYHSLRETWPPRDR